MYTALMLCVCGYPLQITKQTYVLSKDIVKQLSEVYRKIRNTFRFLLGNLDDFNPNTDKVAYADMSEFDKWALLRLEEVRQKSF